MIVIERDIDELLAQEDTWKISKWPYRPKYLDEYQIYWAYKLKDVLYQLCVPPQKLFLPALPTLKKR